MVFDLMPEYLLEVGEHLSGISAGLLRLEALPPDDVSRPDILQALFRSFHTVKGLSAMVQLTEIEQFAHRCESLLRLRNSPKAMISEKVVDTLIAATSAMSERIQLLETGADSAAQKLPDFPPELIEKLESLQNTLKDTEARGMEHAALSGKDYPGIPSEVLAKLTAIDAAQLQHARRRGHGIFLVEFTPSKEFLDQGLSITTLLQRIGEVGRVIRNIPLTRKRAPGEQPAQVTFVLLFACESATAEVAERLAIPNLNITCLEDAAANAQAGQPAAPGQENAPSLAAAKSLSRTASQAADDEASVVIRIGLQKMDEIMRLTGELMITKSRLLSGLQRLDASGSERELAHALSEDGMRLERGLRTLREAILETRLVPVREAFHRLPLVLRDIMRGSDKKVRLIFSGEQIELDRMIVERLVDPLIHLVRNAFDHGIEDPEQRSKTTKNPQATIHVSATREGNHVVIEVRDDGAGINIARIAEKARGLGIDVPADDAFTMADILICLTRPGFTTQSQASRISGRGVGMDVVAHNVAGLNGILSVDSTPGIGTAFTMKIPITLSVTEAMLVLAAGQVFAIPIGMVTETFALLPSDISQIERNRVSRFRDAAILTLSLQELYDLPGQFEWEKEHPALLTDIGKDQVIIAIDAFIGKQEIVIKSLEDPLVRVAGVVGAAELGDGQVVLILDLPGMLALKRRGRHGS